MNAVLWGCMNDEVLQELREQRKLLEAVHTSVEKTRKYFQWTLIITIVLFVLPLLGLLFAIPSFISLYTETLTF